MVIFILILSYLFKIIFSLIPLKKIKLDEMGRGEVGWGKEIFEFVLGFFKKKDILNPLHYNIKLF